MGTLKEKTREAFSSVLPVSAIVLAMGTLLVPMPIGTIAMFLAGAALLVVGMGFFSLGADMAMMPIGEGLGSSFTKINKWWWIAGLAFVMGVIITMAEPDLDVLAGQVASIPSQLLIVTVAAGVGIFLAISLLRIVFRVKLSRLLIICYLGIFLLSIWVPRDFLAVAFDSGGVTTGPITVPFILALGVGMASTRSDKGSQDDSFGLVALSSIGPILAVMLMGIVYRPQEAVYESVVVPQVETMRDVLRQFATQMPHFGREVLLAMLPICGFFLIFQLLTRKFSTRRMLRIGVGIAYTYIGLVLFLTGVNVGFIPVGNLLGAEIAASSWKWLLIPLGALIGYFIVAAEPAVHVLNRQVEDVSGGTIPASAMKLCLSVGVAVSVGLAMLRVLTGISIYWLLIPGYAIALLLSFFVPDIFTGIAFDSGGVASGPMTSTFLLPFAMGACDALGGNIMTDAFGIVAMVAMTPLIAVQLMGLWSSRKTIGKGGEDDAQSIADMLEYGEAEA